MHKYSICVEKSTSHVVTDTIHHDIQADNLTSGKLSKNWDSSKISCRNIWSTEFKTNFSKYLKLSEFKTNFSKYLVYQNLEQTFQNIWFTEFKTNISKYMIYIILVQVTWSMTSHLISDNQQTLSPLQSLPVPDQDPESESRLIGSAAAMLDDGNAGPEAWINSHLESHQNLGFHPGKITILINIC